MKPYLFTLRVLYFKYSVKIGAFFVHHHTKKVFPESEMKINKDGDKNKTNTTCTSSLDM